MRMNTDELVQIIANTITEKKGSRVLAVDISDISTMTDYCIIAEGNVAKHLQAIAGAVIEMLKKHGLEPVHVEGMSACGWIILDYLDIMVHIFVPNVREKYQLERLWNNGKIIDLEALCEK